MQLKEFFAEQPPGTEVSVTLPDLVDQNIDPPDITAYCANEQCRRFQVFMCSDLGSRLGPWFDDGEFRGFASYFCRNCMQSQRLIAFMGTRSSIDARMAKLGEWPPFGPHVSSRVSTLVGSDRELFFKGRRAEAQGLGVGAFAYYRRVVENQRNRLIDAIMDVAKESGADEEALEKLELAKRETQFQKSIDLCKDAMPESILIRGHNPLTLLYKPLSEGIHGKKTDDECLQIAHAIRVILNELAAKVQSAKQNKAEITSAVSRLLTSGE